MRLLDYEIDRLIEEDVISIDLTSHLLGIEEKTGRISIFTREDGVISGSEEVARIFQKFGIEIEGFIPSGRRIYQKDILISGIGSVGSLHQIWKVSQNILDYSSGIATKASKLVSKARVRNPDVMILTTRKSFPGTRKLATKAIVAGGALPHRLNISETVLVFKNHLNIIGGLDILLKKIPGMKKRACEKKIIVETDSVGKAFSLAEAGVDGIQFDKLSFSSIKDGIRELKNRFPQVTVLVAGGINERNIEEFSDSSVDGIVTSSLYSSKPLDLGTRIELI